MMAAPLQASVAVGATALTVEAAAVHPPASALTTMAGRGHETLNTGPTVSWMVKVAVVVLKLPQASEALKITVAEPVAPQRSDNAVKSLVQVTALQLSVADAPPW